MNNLESTILWENAKALGIDLLSFYIKAGEEIATKLIKKFTTEKSYAVICGIEGNGADGLATAFYLAEKGAKVTLYIAGRAKYSKNPAYEKIWEEVYKWKEQIEIKQDCYAKDIQQHHVVVEALVGTGKDGDKLNKRYLDIIKRITHFNSNIIAIDTPCGSYQPHAVYSIHYPKTPQAQVIQVPYPKELTYFAGPGERQALKKSYNKSYKNRNGNVLIITDSEVDEKSLAKVKKAYPTEFKIFKFSNDEKQPAGKDLSAKDLSKLIEEADTILITKVEETLISFATLRHLLKTNQNKNFVITADILEMIEIKNLKPLQNKALIVSGNNLKSLGIETGFNKQQKGIKRLCVENNMHAIVLGMQTRLYSADGQERVVQNTEKKQNHAEIAYAISAYSTRNNMWLSVRAAA